MTKSTVRFTCFPRTEPPPAFVAGIVEPFRACEPEVGTLARDKGLTSDEVLARLRPHQLALEAIRRIGYPGPSLRSTGRDVMTETASNAQRSLVLGRLSRAKGEKASSADLAKLLSGEVARESGFDDAGVAADRVVGELIAEGLVKEIGRAPETGGRAPHPHPRSAYQLTDQGKEQARLATRPAKPGHSDQLLARQKAFILLQFVRAEDEGRTLARSKLTPKLKTNTARITLEIDGPTIDYSLFTLTEQGCLNERKVGSGTVYELTDEGLRHLVAAEQYESAKFTLKGAQLNALLAVAREAAVQSLGPPEPDAVTAPAGEAGAPMPIFEGDAVLRILEEMRRGEYANTRLIPIHEVRRRVARDYGPGAAGHDVFDAVLRRLHGDGRLDMIAISDKRKSTREQLADSIEGVNEILFYVVSHHEPARV
jgi:DNA-binding PadR family transcriptional regulator